MAGAEPLLASASDNPKFRNRWGTSSDQRCVVNPMTIAVEGEDFVGDLAAINLEDSRILRPKPIRMSLTLWCGEDIPRVCERSLKMFPMRKGYTNATKSAAWILRRRDCLAM